MDKDLKPLIGNKVVQSQCKVLATSQAEQRIATIVLRLIKRAGKKTEEGTEIDFPITRREIAQMTATTLHTVSRILSRWERESFLSSTRKHIVITNAHKLLLIAEGRRG